MLKKIIALIMLTFSTTFITACGKYESSSNDIVMQYEEVAKKLQKKQAEDKNPVKDPNFISQIESLASKSLELQYNKSNEKALLDILSTDYIKKLDNYFYKIKSVPYKILNFSPISNLDTNYNKFSIKVNIKDKMGEYEQEMIIIKINDKYYIDNILYKEY